MDLAKIEQLAEKLMAHRKVHAEREVGGAHAHGKRVAVLAAELKKRIFPGEHGISDELKAAAWFHDVGKGIEPHARYGAAITREALSGLCTKEQLDEICAYVSEHAYRDPQNNSYSANTKLLQDADLLDHYGTFAVWMDFFYDSHKEKSFSESAVDNDFHLEKHRKTARDALNYNESKRIFDEKIAFVSAFYARMRIEAEGLIAD